MVEEIHARNTKPAPTPIYTRTHTHSHTFYNQSVKHQWVSSVISKVVFLLGTDRFNFNQTTLSAYLLRIILMKNAANSNAN